MRQVNTDPLSWYEFFAGGGMARLGLGDKWQCTFSNEWCEKKAETYKARFGSKELRVCDVARLTPDDLPGAPMLVWGSFPCQDLSLAGSGAGLKGARSGTFIPFWELIRKMGKLGRQPRIIALENVVGTLTSHEGRDFTFIIDSITRDGYRVGAVVVDAVRFLPHSRPRLFIIGVHQDVEIPPQLVTPEAVGPWHTKSLESASDRLTRRSRENWVWWKMPIPTEPTQTLTSLIEQKPVGVAWHTKEQTDRIISLMSPLHRTRLRKAQLLGKEIVGTVYKRMRLDDDGVKIQRAEVRFDQISGCLRTPIGGSSRQTIIIVDGKRVRSRLLSPREAARLMGVPDDYPLPDRYNDAYHLFGDGVAVPVVAWLNRHLLLPIAASTRVMIAA